MADFAASIPDYDLHVATPFASAMQGYQAGVAIRDDQQKQAQLVQQQEAEREQSRMIRDLISNPSAGAAEYARVMALVPRLAEPIAKGWAMKDKAQQQSLLNDLTQWSAAVQNNRPEIASAAMRARADALENTAGGPTPESKAMRANADVVDAHPKFANAMVMKPMLMAHPDGARIVDSIAKMGQEDRAQEQFPSTLRKAEAEAGKAVTEAETTKETAPAARAKAFAEAGIAGANAQTQPEKNRLELLKVGTDLGLTNAQINETLERTKKLRVETQKMALELGGAGSIDPEKKFTFESNLRREYSDQTKGFQETKESFQRIKAAKNDGAGDLSLVYSFMKMLDPGSVVREGEFANAENAGGAWAKVGNLYNRVMNGERLTPSQRKTFLGQAENLMNAAGVREKTVRGGIDQVVKSYRLNPDNVFYDAGSDSSASAAPAGQPSAASTPALPSNLRGRKWTQY